MIYVANAFSLQMLEGDDMAIRVQTIPKGGVEHTLREASYGDGWTSAVGHADTANVISDDLRMDVPHNRINITLRPGDVLFVGQITGGRLPEGATSLPDGVRIIWRRVEVEVPYEII